MAASGERIETMRRVCAVQEEKFLAARAQVSALEAKVKELEEHRDRINEMREDALQLADALTLRADAAERERDALAARVGALGKNWQASAKQMRAAVGSPGFRTDLGVKFAATWTGLAEEHASSLLALLSSTGETAP